MNAFLDVADQQMTNAVKVKHRVAEARVAKQMVVSPAEKKMRDQERMVRFWKAYRREAQDELKVSPFAKEIAGLRTFIRTMTPQSAPALVRLIQNSVWLKDADADTRYRLLTVVSDGIRRLREKHGMPPFDDALPGEPLTAYDQIKEILR